MNELPHSREAEEALLGSMLINSALVDKVTLGAEDFYFVRNQQIFRAIKGLGANDSNIVSVSEVLKRRGQEVGDGYLISLINASPNAYNYEVHEKIVKDNSSRRKVLEIASKLANGAYDGNKSITDVVSENVSDLVMTAKPAGKTHHVSKFLKDLYEQAEERAKDPKEIYGLETGLRDFDKITHGLQKKEELILSGSPGTGKTLLAVQLAFGLAKNGHPGIIYELEMSGVALVRRQVSALSKLKTYNIRSGIGMDNHWTKFAEAIGETEKLPLYISEESSWSTVQLRADLARMKQGYDIDWFIVDYMENLADKGERDERMTKIAKNLHAIAKDLDIAALIIQSVIKSGFNSSRGSMGDVSGPHNVAHEADDICIVTKGTPDNPNLENVVTLTWDKKREADDAGMLHLYKVPGLPLFEQYKKEVEDVDVPSWYNN